MSAVSEVVARLPAGTWEQLATCLRRVERDHMGGRVEVTLHVSRGIVVRVDVAAPVAVVTRRTEQA